MYFLIFVKIFNIYEYLFIYDNYRLHILTKKKTLISNRIGCQTTSYFRFHYLFGTRFKNVNFYKIIQIIYSPLFRKFKRKTINETTFFIYTSVSCGLKESCLYQKCFKLLLVKKTLVYFIFKIIYIYSCFYMIGLGIFYYFVQIQIRKIICLGNGGLLYLDKDEYEDYEFEEMYNNIIQKVITFFIKKSNLIQNIVFARNLNIEFRLTHFNNNLYKSHKLKRFYWLTYKFIEVENLPKPEFYHTKPDKKKK